MTQLLTAKQVASLLQVTTVTLENWRGTNQGPEWIKLGDKSNSPVRYTQAAIDKYLTERIRK